MMTAMVNQDQPLEMVVERAEEPGGFGIDKSGLRLTSAHARERSRGEAVLPGPKFPIGGDRHEARIAPPGAKGLRG